LQRPRRYPEPLARVVAEPDEPEPPIRPPAHERAGRTAELAAHRGLAAAREPQLEVHARREARALRLQRAVGFGRGLLAAPNGITARAPQPAHHPAQLEESPWSTTAVGGEDHLRSIPELDMKELPGPSRLQIGEE
jgi:hypothetical protein